jgi:hypothetical protein
VAAAMPPPVPPMTEMQWLTEELCMQQLSDMRLQSVLATLAPGCIPATSALTRIRDLITTAVNAIDGTHPTCVDPVVEPPPPKETSLLLLHRINSNVDD